MARIAIVEPDLKLAGRLEALALRASGLLPEKLETEVFSSGEDFFGGLGEGGAFSLVIAELDGGGLEFGLRLRERFDERETLLVYISGQTGFDARLLETRPFLLLQSPVEDKDFMRGLFSALEHMQKSDELFIVKQGRITYQLKKRDIICLESIGREIVLAAKDHEDIRYREALKNEREKLKTVNFVRPHNSFVVNLDYVEEYRSDSLKLANRRLVPISELRSREVKQEILKFWEYRNI